MQGQYYIETELYMLIEERNSSIIFTFLSHFLKDWKVLEDEFSYPAFSDEPLYATHDIIDFLNFLDKNQDFDYNLYFQTINQSFYARQLIAIYPKGNFLIIGLLIDPDEIEATLHQATKISPKLRFAYIDSQLPDIDYFNFINCCSKSEFTKLINGEIIIH